MHTSGSLHRQRASWVCPLAQTVLLLGDRILMALTGIRDGGRIFGSIIRRNLSDTLSFSSLSFTLVVDVDHGLEIIGALVRTHFAEKRRVDLFFFTATGTSGLF